MSATDPLSPPPDGVYSSPSPVEALPSDLGGWAPGGDATEVTAVPLQVAPLPLPEPIPVVRARPPHPGFFWGSLWSVGFFLFLNGAVIGALCVVVVVKAVLSGDPRSYISGLVARGQPTEELMILLAPAYLFAEVCSVAFAWGVIRLAVGRDWRRWLSVRLPSPEHFFLALAALPALLTMPGLVHQLAATFLPSLGNLQSNAELFSTWPLWFSVVVVGVLPGIGEELWCRGFLGRGFVGHYGWLAGVLLTSLWFGVLHVDPPYIVATAVMGVWLHYVYLTTRSLPLSMFLHALNNSLAVVFSKYGAEVKPILAPTDHYAVLAAIGLVMAAVAWALFRGRARLASLDDGGGPAWRPAFTGVEAPPAGSGTAVVRPGAGAVAWGLVLAALAVFAGSVVLAVRLGDALP